MILDTSYLLDLKSGDPSAFERGVEMQEQDVVQRVTVISVTELHYGAQFLQSEDERRRVRNLVRAYPLVSIDERTAVRAAELVADADRRNDGSSGVESEDGYIGAVADQFGEPVLTRNVDDFEKLGVDVETY
ncbi:hypothetical protein AUR64_09625 [Haloprofundus marisrubri]|uniref:PIN domain-containing protein n=1 Tax=Haloprofundus marisrubri TaxID=1514971 RepID=A0A0W1R8E0_9EURY|nr:PIN domain-containing protein [Haloprofundus marisrubri]KTG09876.1 hypothetical protein AUR64_09625 [Haloprofundus marisrubri]